MDSIDNILAAGSSVIWTNEEAEIDDIEALYSFPQIVKVTASTSEKYSLPENEPVMLYGKRRLIRTVAQTVEEGNYVMGKQVEISNEFHGSFRISHDYERDEAPLKKFLSIQEVADFFPPKVYVLEQVTVAINRSEEGHGRGNHVVLEQGDELTLISRCDTQPVVGNASKPASRFISKVMSRASQHQALIVHNTRLKTSLTIPLTVRGSFATRSPMEVAQSDRARDMSLLDLVDNANFPITVIVSSNRTRSTKDEFVLRSGMHLKLMGVEEHDIVLAVTPFQRIVEFRTTDDTFYLPAALVKPQVNEKDKTQYLTFVQSTYMATQLQSSVTNVDNYCKSVRFHIPRHLRPTNPTPLPANAKLRQPILVSRSAAVKKPPKGMSAIQLLSQSQAENANTSRTTSRTTNTVRRPMPAPNLPAAKTDGPPLPPRNNRTTSNPKSPRTGSRKVPPVPPKTHSRHTICIPNDMPLRPPPLPFAQDTGPTLAQNGHRPTSASSETTRDVDSRPEDDIWEEWKPISSKQTKNEENDDAKQQEVVSSVEHRKDSVAGDAINQNQEVAPVRRDDVTTPKNVNDVIERNRIDSPSFDLPRVLAQNGDQDDIYEPASDAEVPANEALIGASSSVTADDDVVGGAELSPVVVDSLNPPSIATGVAVCDDTSSRRSMLSDDDMDAASQSHSKMSQKRYVSPPVDWNPPDDTGKMSVEEVVNSLRYIGISEDIVQYFYNERIDGVMLSEISDEILEEDFELGKLYRYKITRFLAGWRPKVASQTTS